MTRYVILEAAPCINFANFHFEMFLKNCVESDALFHNLTVEASFESLMVYFPILVAHTQRSSSASPIALTASKSSSRSGRSRHLGITEDALPFTEGEFGGEDDRGARVEAADELESDLGRLARL